MEEFLKIDKSYCISLEKNRDKWNDIILNIRNHGFESCQIFNAINGSTVPNIDNLVSIWQEYILKFKKPRHNHEQFSSYGAIGCYLSHYSIWKDAYEEGYDRIAVFEDDISFYDDIQNIIKKSYNYIDPNYDLLLLGSYPLEETIITKDVSKVDRFLRTQSYIITRKCIEKLMSRIFPIEIQIDSYMSYMIKLYSLKAYNICGTTDQSLHMSDIQTNCFDCPYLSEDQKYLYRFVYIVVLLIIVFIVYLLYKIFK